MLSSTRKVRWEGYLSDKAFGSKRMFLGLMAFFGVGVMAFNFFGDWMRDTMDPKLRRA